MTLGELLHVNYSGLLGDTVSAMQNDRVIDKHIYIYIYIYIYI